MAGKGARSRVAGGTDSPSVSSPSEVNSSSRTTGGMELATQQEVMELVESINAERAAFSAEREELRQEVQVLRRHVIENSLSKTTTSLPTLADMVKGFTYEQYYSGQESDDENSWLEFRGRVLACCRHSSLAILLVENRRLSEIKAHPDFSVEVNALLYDFLVRVTKKTASTVVRAYANTADGCAAWARLHQLRRNTGCAYFVRVNQALFAQAAKLGALGNPLPVFLEVRGLLHKIREYVSATSAATLASIDIATVEVLFVAQAVHSLHLKYEHIKAKFVTDLPSFAELEESTCAHWDNILSVSVGAVEQGAGLAEDRRRQEERKKKELSKKVECSTCHAKGHSAENCFMTNVTAREEFLKRRPELRGKIEKRAQSYAQRGTTTGAAGALAPQEEILFPGIDDTGKKLFALSETSSPSCYVCPDIEDTEEALCSLSVVEQCAVERGQLDLEGVLFTSPRKHAVARSARVRRDEPGVVPVALSNRYSVLAEVQSPCEAVRIHRDGLVLDCFYAWRKRASRSRRAAMRTARRGPVKVKAPRQCTGWESIRHCFSDWRQGSVAPVYCSFVYVDTVGAFFPGRYPAGQAAWEAGRLRCLGSGYQISSRQFWYTPSLQYVHTAIVTRSYDVLECAEVVLHDMPGLEVVHRLDLSNQRDGLMRVSDRLRGVLAEEPVVVRGTVLDLKFWGARLGVATRDVICAVEEVQVVVHDGYGAGADSASDDGSDWGEHQSDGHDDDRGEGGAGGHAGLLGEAVLSSADCGEGQPARGVYACTKPTERVDPLGKKTALLDSGATCHVWSELHHFDHEYFDPDKTTTFRVVQNGTVESEGSGRVTL